MDTTASSRHRPGVLLDRKPDAGRPWQLLGRPGLAKLPMSAFVSPVFCLGQAPGISLTGAGRPLMADPLLSCSD